MYGTPLTGIIRTVMLRHPSKMEVQPFIHMNEEQ